MQSGQQYRYRLVIQYALGYSVDGYHVHHVDGDKANDDLGNLEVVDAWYHGSVEAWGATMAGRRDEDGRFAAVDTVGSPYRLSRDKWLISAPVAVPVPSLSSGVDSGLVD